MLANQLRERSEKQKRLGLYRQRRVRRATSQGLSFSSNDYLSLGDEPQIKKAYQEGFRRYSVGSGGSMMVSGYHDVHQALEKAFSEALGVDDSVLFPSGFAANLGVVDMLCQHDAHILLDKASHASIYHALQTSPSSYTRYCHQSWDAFLACIKKSPMGSVVVTESIFSMSGYHPPLQQMVEAIALYQHHLVVDEAHAFGVIGPEGLGSVAEHYLTQAEVPLRVIPFGKALGAAGAIVSGKGEWIDAIVQKARSLIYSTSMSPAMAYGMLETLSFVRSCDDRRRVLHELVTYFCNKANLSSLSWAKSITPIQQLRLGCPKLAMHYAEKLSKHGIICHPMRQPTVKKSETGLRIVLNYHHQQKDIDYLFEALEE